MALIGEIRKRSWILIVFIGLGMGGFLLMDMLQNNNSGFGNSTSVGEIAGKDISITEFQRRQEELYGNSQASQFQVRDGVWQYYVREAIIQGEAEALGLGVSEEEMNELLYGPNPQSLSPIIRQAFGGQTGQVDMAQLAQIRQRVESGTMTPEESAYWNTLQSQIKLDRLETKINSIASAAVYTPGWMAEMEFNATNQKADFRFVGIPYATISDEEVKVSDSELKSYIKENRGKFTNDEETHKFNYVLFNVQPTKEDSVKIAATLSEEIAEWSTTEDDSLFVVNSTGGIYSNKYDFKDALAPQVADTLAQIAKGTIIGPYIDGSKYKIAKLLDKKVIPDSVKARHILRPIEQNDPNGFAKLQSERSLLDSLIRELKAGTVSFDSLAAQYGTDGTKDKGGDLGVFAPGQMVPEFNDLVFYDAEVGEYRTVITQYGIHLVQVNNKYTSGKMGYKVGYLQESIVPSQETEKEIFKEASKFAAELEGTKDLDAKAKKAGYEIQVSTVGAKVNDYRIIGVGEGQAARDIIKWSYKEADQGDASREVYTFESTGEDLYIEKYAVIGLVSVAEEGLASLDDPAVRLQAETAVRNRKKAELIKAKIKKGQSLDAVATANKSQVQTASQVSLNITNVPGMGTEPKVVGKVFNKNTKTNTVLDPIAGNTAVYVVEVTFKPEATAPTDLPTAKQQASAQVKGQIGSRLFESLRKVTDITDTRYRFF